MNFSGIYEVEPFANNPRFIHLDCSHLHGTDCYCDEDGARSIRRIIAPTLLTEYTSSTLETTTT